VGVHNYESKFGYPPPQPSPARGEGRTVSAAPIERHLAALYDAAAFSVVRGRSVK